MEATLTLNSKFLEGTQMEAQAVYTAEFEEENDRSGNMHWEDLTLKPNDFEVSTSGLLRMSGDLHYVSKADGKKYDAGWLDIGIQLSTDNALEVIEYYMKKLGKLKTVLEATK